MQSFHFSLVPALAFALLLGPTCREDLPTPDYSSHIGLADRIDAGLPEGFLAGTDPLEEGEQRLKIGLAYEGRFTREITVGTGVRNVFAFDLNGDGTGDFTIDGSDSFDRVEGRVSSEVTHAGFGFWGFGVFYVEQTDSAGTRGGSVDFSDWRVLHLALKSSDDAFEDIDIEMQSDFGAGLGSVSVSDYGYVNDGEWHPIDIPLADFEAQGVNLRDITAPFVLGGGAGLPGETFLFDEVYFTD
ncbi:MAG: hypothetical protein AAGH15_06070 [Myxococcota bacterium]